MGKPKKRKPLPPAMALARQRMAVAVHMKAADGATYRQISEFLGVSKPAVRRYFKRHRAELTKQGMGG